MVAVMLKVLIAWLRWRARHAQKSSFSPGMVRSVAIFELTRLGDFVTVLPALRKLRQQFPGALFHLVVDAKHAPLLSMCEPDMNVMGIASPWSVLGLLRALSTVRGLHPDLACSMSPSSRNAALALASGSRFIAGYLAGTGTLTPFLGVTPAEMIGFPEQGPAMFGRENIQGRAWKVLQTLGIHESGDAGDAFRKWAPSGDLRRKLGGTPGGEETPYIVIHPFSGWKYRSWPLESFRILAQMILGEFPHRIVFVCHVSEKEALEPLVTAFRGEARVRFLPSADILTTAALLRDARLFIGNDSGPLHLAALLEVPLVGLFGPASPELTAPLSARGRFLYREVACSPCSQTVCIMPGNSCMMRITPEEVQSAAKEELESAYKHRGAVNE
jgi:heptosyltransferase-2